MKTVSVYIRMKYVVFLCLCLVNLSNGARILGVFPMAAPSHYILGNALMKGLAESGHDVTIISPFKEKQPPKNGSWKEIFLDGVMEKMNEKLEKFDMYSQESSSPLFGFLFLYPMGNQQTEDMLKHPNVQKLIKSNEKFDAVIVSQFVNDGMYTLAKHFGGHLVVFSNQGANTWNNHQVGNPSLPSFYSEIALHFPRDMTFMQRIKNTLFKVITYVYLYTWFYPIQDQLAKTYISPSASLYEEMYNVSLLLLNSHVSISNPQALVPNMIEIGGFHIKPSKTLPQDLQKFLDESAEGVIYFSMGSNLKSRNLPVQTRESILKAFGKRKEKILWKWEADELPGQPPNVYLSKWFPQQDLLGHPNVKVFITHGGLLSTTEAIYLGVPTICIPIYGDQKGNAYAAKNAGYGLVMPFPEITEEKLTELLDEIINNPKYRKNVKERSMIMHDRKVKPLDEAIHWVEYIIRHNGAKHLRVGYLHLNWYEYYLLDVFSLVFISMVIIFIILRKLCSYICCKVSKKYEKVKKH